MIKILVFYCLISAHPVHVSLTSVTQDRESDSLKVSFRMYYDDFQLDFRQFYPGFVPGSGNDSLNYDSGMLQDFFNNRVNISTNGRIMPGRLTGFSINEYEIQMELVYPSLRKIKKIMIVNQILTKIYSDQANMVYLKILDYENAAKLTVEEPEVLFKL